MRQRHVDRSCRRDRPEQHAGLSSPRAPRRRIGWRWGRDERAVETTAMILVLPFLVVMILALIDVGLMFQTRMEVTSVVRDTVRNIAAEGGNHNDRTTRLEDGQTWVDLGNARLWKNGSCTFGRCSSQPKIVCDAVSHVDGQTYTNITVIRNTGDEVDCHVDYPYVGINEALLNSPLGLGFGTVIKPFVISASARSETGANG